MAKIEGFLTRLYSLREKAVHFISEELSDCAERRMFFPHNRLGVHTLVMDKGDVWVWRVTGSVRKIEEESVEEAVLIAALIDKSWKGR